jgi:hypothetical protein
MQNHYSDLLLYLIRYYGRSMKTIIVMLFLSQIKNQRQLNIVLNFNKGLKMERILQNSQKQKIWK